MHQVTELPKQPRRDPVTILEFQPEPDAPNPLEAWADIPGIITRHPA